MTDERHQTDGRLLTADQAGTFTERWEHIQAGFVDEPRESSSRRTPSSRSSSSG